MNHLPPHVLSRLSPLAPPQTPSGTPPSVTASGDDMIAWIQYARSLNGFVSRLETNPHHPASYTLHFVWPSENPPD